MSAALTNPPSNARKLWLLLTSDQRRAAAVLLVLMLISTGLETLGIGLVIPALSMVMQPGIPNRYPALAAMVQALGHPGRETVVVGFIVAIFGVYLLKSAFLAYLAWRQNKFSFDLTAALSQRLFTQYLRQPYAFHLQRNSSQLIQVVVGEVDILMSSVVAPGMLLLAEALVLCGLSVLMIAVEPIGSIAAVVSVAAVALSFGHLSHPHNVRWGAERQLHAGHRLQHLQQGLNGVKDVKLLGREADFLQQFRLHNEQYARAGRLQNTLLRLPQIWLELLAMGGLTALVTVMVSRGQTVEAIIPTLGLFAAAAFRTMPSVNRVVGSIQALKFGLPAIETVFDELHLLPAADAQPRAERLPFDSALVLEQVTFRYAPALAPALCTVSLSIPRGAAVGFVGTTGAGKSTLVDVILGLLTPDSGTVRVDGRDIQQHLRGWQDQVGYVPQSIFLTDDTLRRNVALGLSNEQIDDAAVSRAIQAAQLAQFVSELPQGLDTMVGERGIRLSGGQRQRIGIARALYHDPPVVVLDEATSSLDTNTERDVMETVRALRGDKTLIIVAHRLSTVERCDHLFRLERGRLVHEHDTDAGARAASQLHGTLQ